MAARAADTVPFVGRARPLRALDAALGDARRGAGRLVLVAGDPGIGKTRTVEEFLARHDLARDRVLWGRCPEQPGAPAYWPWRRMLGSLLGTRAGDALQTWLGAEADAVARLVPVVRERIDTSAAPEDPEQSRFRLFEAVVTLLRRVALEEILVLVFDDLHWADEASLDLLGFMARELDDAPLLVIGTHREHAAGRALRGLLDVGRGAHRIVLRGLERDEVETVVSHATSSVASSALIDGLLATTEGNPFFLSEVLKTFSGDPLPESVRPLDLPDSVRNAVRRRLEPLAPEERAVLAAASVVGREFDVAVLAAVTELPIDTVFERVTRAVALGLIDESDAPGRFRFAHALVRETSYADVPPAERVRLHRRVGLVLETRYGDSPDVPAGELALHFFHAAPLGEAARAVAYATRAARQATRVFAWGQATEHYQRALTISSLGPGDEGERLRLLLALGEVARRGGNGAVAREALVQVARRAKALGDTLSLVTAAMRYVQVSPVSAAVDLVAVRLLEEALAASGDDDSPGRSILLSLLAQASYFAPDRTRCRALGNQALAMAQRLDEPVALSTALLCRQLTLLGAGGPEDRLGLADRTIEIGQGLHSTDITLASVLSRILCLLELGRIVEATAAVEQLVGLADETQRSEHHWLATVHRGTLALLAGRLEEATRLAAAALALRHDARDLAVKQVFWAQTFLIRRDTGDATGLEAAVRGLVEEFPAVSIWRCVLALLLAGEGNNGAAAALLDELGGNGFGDLPDDCFLPASLATLAEVAVVLRDGRAARALQERLTPFASRNIVLALYSPGCLGSTERYLGLLSACLGDVDGAIGHLELAIAMNERLRAPLLVARARTDLARMLLHRAASGDRERAGDLLAVARASAGLCNARRLEQRIAELQSSAPSRPDAAADVPSTPAASGEPLRATLRREGDFWTVAHGADVFRLKDTKGLRHLVLLLKHPRQEFHVLDMEGGTAAGSDEPTPRVAGDAGELLDAKARSAYRSRLEDLRDELEEARRFNDPGRAQRAEEEMDFLTGEISRAVGLSGRSRRAASAAERARINVTRTLGAVMRKIAAESPGLGQHLTAAVSTGIFCSYAPDPRLPLTWLL